MDRRQPVRLAALLAGLLLSAPAWAHEASCPVGGTDGQQVAASAGVSSERSGIIGSASFDVRANWLCCNRAAGACSDFDTSQRQGGVADAYIVSLESLGTCTVVDIDVGFKETATGTTHTVGTLTLSTTSLVIDGPRGRIVTATVNTMTGCAGGGEFADVQVNSYYERGNRGSQ